MAASSVSASSPGQPEPLRRRLRVGVTLMLRDGHQSIWENGIFQNCAFLVQLLNRSPIVAEAVLVVDRQEVPPIGPGMMLDDAGIRMVALPEAMATLDVVIEMSAQLSEDWLIAFRAKGGRYVWMRVGNDYVIDIERAMFDKPHAGLSSAKKYDAVWTLAEYQHSCTDYFALTARAPVRIVPHIWTPLFFDRGMATLPAPLRYGYTPGRKRWRICSFEPNVCMVKTSFIPMLICEEAYRARPGLIDSVRVCNTLHMKEHPLFIQFANQLDIVRHGVASFEGRFAIYEFMANHGDVIVSHQWENSQNYLYYEALYGDYPLIHNSPLLRHVGYYYPDFDCQAGGHVLVDALCDHDNNLEAYRAGSQSLITQLDVANARNIRAYSEELMRLYLQS